MLKLEKDKLQRRVHDIDEQIKEREQKIQKQLALTHKRQNESPKYSANGFDTFGVSNLGKGGQKLTPFPEDARPNPFLSREYDIINSRLVQNVRIEAHTRGIGGMALHMRK